MRWGRRAGGCAAFELCGVGMVRPEIATRLPAGWVPRVGANTGGLGCTCKGRADFTVPLSLSRFLSFSLFLHEMEA